MLVLILLMIFIFASVRVYLYPFHKWANIKKTKARAALKQSHKYVTRFTSSVSPSSVYIFKTSYTNVTGTSKVGQYKLG